MRWVLGFQNLNCSQRKGHEETQVKSPQMLGAVTRGQLPRIGQGFLSGRSLGAASLTGGFGAFPPHSHPEQWLGRARLYRGESSAKSPAHPLARAAGTGSVTCAQDPGFETAPQAVAAGASASPHVHTRRTTVRTQ